MFSSLQKFIISKCRERGGECSRSALETGAGKAESRAKKENYKKIVTESVERLIERGILIGFGVKTKDKLFIHKIKLTSLGRKEAGRIARLSQPVLPLRRKRDVSS